MKRHYVWQVPHWLAYIIGFPDGCVTIACGIIVGLWQQGGPWRIGTFLMIAVAIPCLLFMVPKAMYTTIRDTEREIRAQRASRNDHDDGSQSLAG